ncbi:uncharacterized protein E0L32_011223 [Thyridium curvatum]|uniref:Uncharacterized protein n=1 Tax=Thyridium curvatum TaxID=1093900 RepID=A0A507B9Q4_9PEZI|nr:uncharacterized protein E0L32_011223 [Thyridium curvatum]TPX19062.1 hypothetical protein E0L32_011223 [Thyridium curvatum]
MASTIPRLPVFEALQKHDPESTAVIHSVSGRSFKYGELLGDVCRTRNRLLEAAGKSDIGGERVAFLVENSYDYVVTLLAILAARSIAVPLSPAFPAPELQYILDHSEAALLLSSAKFSSKAKEVLALNLASKPVHLELSKHQGGGSHEQVTLEGDGAGAAGMMLYTSGTTNRPKGVLLPQRVMTAQAQSLLDAWEYSPSDHLLHVLPLHHIHGTINAIFAPLFAGSTVEFMFPFNADAVWHRLAAPFLTESKPHTNGTNGVNGVHGTTDVNVNGINGVHKTANGDHSAKRVTAKKNPISFFTVVPTVYSRLLSTHRFLPLDVQEAGRKAVSPEYMRLSISGSAALPAPIKKAWAKLSHGNVLLERYGMTEVGMALSCGLDSVDRVDGSVGWPLPSVEARLVDVDTGDVILPGQELTPDGRERAGEIQLRGPTIFAEYWRNPEATKKEFVPSDEEGGRPWFKTGDVAVRRSVEGAGQSTRASQGWTHSGKSSPGSSDMYFILGRKSADIIKSGGEKVSALEVERELLSLPEVAEAAVCAVPSGKWGQKVGCVLILNKENLEPSGGKWTPMDMRRALKGRLANYKIPQVMRVVEHIPRNAMGKINKKLLVAEIFRDDHSGDEM